MFKAKTLIEKGGTRNLNQLPYQLSRQFLTTASTFTCSSKNSSAEHIHALSTWLIIANTHSLTQANTHTHAHRQTHTHSSAEHILALLACHHHKQTHSHRQTKHTHTRTRACTHTDTCTHTHTLMHSHSCTQGYV